MVVVLKKSIRLMTLSTAKAITVFYDKAMEVMNSNNLMAQMVDVYNVPSAVMQNTSNIFWRPVEQHAPIKDGWTVTAGNVIEQYYPSQLSDPRNDYFALRADDFRDERFLERRAMAAAKKLSADQNKRIATTVATTGSLFYRNAAAEGGFQFIANADRILTERQASGSMGTSFFLNPRDNNRIAADLAERGTLSGRPEGAYASAMVGRDVAGFDVYKTNFQSTLAGGESPAGITVTTAISDKPVGQTGNVNQDYRESSDITLSDSSALNVGDIITFGTGDTEVHSVGLLDKTLTGEAMTFRIVEKAEAGNTIKVYPRPIALNDKALNAEEVAYANIENPIAAAVTVQRLNTDAATITNTFWANDSVELISGDVPFEMFSELDGFKVVSETLDSGVKLYMAYQGDIGTMNLNVRLFTWYGVTNRDPSRNGVGILATA